MAEDETSPKGGGRDDVTRAPRTSDRPQRQRRPGLLSALGLSRFGLSRRGQVQILHIGKTGGTQLIQMCREINERLGRPAFVPHGHAVRLRDLPARAPYVFGIRQPVARFRSAFYSRKRKGQPRYDSPWSEGEARVFAGFPEANDLAEALFDTGRVGAEARGGINTIYHTAMQQVDWFTPMGYFLHTRPPVAILRQEHLAQDWATLIARLRLQNVAPQPSDDPVTAHRNDYAGTPDLSARAIENLTIWYARDFAFYDTCAAWQQERTASARLSA